MDKDANAYDSFSFDLSLNAQDFPKIYSRQQWGSRELRWDVSVFLKGTWCCMSKST